MKNQTRLTSFGFEATLSHLSISPSSSAPSSRAVSVDAPRVPYMGPSCVSSAASSLAPSPIPSPDPSSIVPSPVNSNVGDNDQGDKLEDDEYEDELEDDNQEVGDDQEGKDKDEDEDNGQEENEADNGQEMDNVVQSEDEEDDMDNFMEASGCEPKEDIRSWSELRDKIRADLGEAHKNNATLTHIKELLVLQNFATLRIRGDGRIAASMQIARQCMDGVGIYFARQIRFVARHYQLFEQLPPQKRGQYLNRSLLNDEQVQTAARTYLTSLSTGEVTPKRFSHMLNERILPSLGYQLKSNLSERTARQWLVRLGWRNKLLRKGVYMDGHERQDVVEYRNKTFLPMMASYRDRMVKWELREGSDELVHADPKLRPGEKRIIALFQDESSFHANEYKRTIWWVT